MFTATERTYQCYSRHEPEKTILYRTIQDHFQTFVARAESKTEKLPFPMHVFQEVEAYLGCGILANGFVVLSFPFSVRYALAYNPTLVTKVLAIYIRVISNWYEKSARRNGISGKTAAVTFVQRFGGAINLNVHFHSLFLDGVFTEKNGKLHFVPVFPPTNEEIVTLVKRVNLRVTRYLEKKGLTMDDFSEDPFAHEQPVLAQIAGASVQSRIGIGEREGQRVRRIGEEYRAARAYFVSERCALSDGFSLHANVQIKGNDRKRLEKLCRYTARPPIALERMSESPDGKILYRLKTKYSDGTTHILFDPLELVEKVVALIPPPRANLLRYHGLLAPN
ncbi:MAG: transposase, partial [Deltaproteobacteria bacterium]